VIRFMNSSDEENILSLGRFSYFWTVAFWRLSFFVWLAGNSFLKGEYRTERRMCCGTGEEMRWSAVLPDARSFMEREGMVLQI